MAAGTASFAKRRGVPGQERCFGGELVRCVAHRDQVHQRAFGDVDHGYVRVAADQGVGAVTGEGDVVGVALEIDGSEYGKGRGVEDRHAAAPVGGPHLATLGREAQVRGTAERRRQPPSTDYLKDRSQRAELNHRNGELGIPFELQSHLVTFVGDDLVLAGHIPTEMIADALTRVPLQERLLVYQDRMPEMGQRVSEYQVWDFRGEATLHPIETPLDQALAGLDLRAAEAQAGAGSTERLGVARLLPLVLAAGLLDGVNPCAIAVLLLSLAVLFTLQRTRRQVLLTGAVYVGMIFVAYLGIGLGLFGAIVISGEQHLVARIGSWLLIALGLVNVKDYFWYGRGFSLSVPKVGHEAVKGWLKRATLPAAAAAGFLVGLCTFPCTGGIYVAILGLLSTQTTYLEGSTYLFAYNVMLVLPLVGLLLVLGNRRSVGALARWQAERKRAVKLVSGLVMVALGAAMLAWFM